MLGSQHGAIGAEGSILKAGVSAENWGRVARGLVSFGALPEGADWLLLGAFAAYSGSGGIGNAYTTNWMRDKGYGMGATVGYIPTVLGDAVKLPAHGNIFRVDAQSLAAWRQWWKYMHLDQWGIFGLGSLAGMALTALFTLQYVPAGTVAGEWAVANLQAEGIAAVHGPIFWFLTLIAGFWVLFSTQLGFVDGIPRAITDMLWTGSPAVRRWRGGDVRAIYYSILFVYIVWGCVSLNLAQPLTLLILAANIGGANLVLLSIHTLVVNRSFLPRELRPPLWREAAILLCALFYGAFSRMFWLMAIVGLVLPAVLTLIPHLPVVDRLERVRLLRPVPAGAAALLMGAVVAVVHFRSLPQATTTWGISSGTILAVAAVLGASALLAFLPVLRRRPVASVVLASLLVNIGMWLKRYIIVVPSMALPLTQSEWATYRPTWVEWSITAAAFAMFILLYTLFAKFFPLISLWEVRESPAPAAAHAEEVAA